MKRFKHLNLLYLSAIILFLSACSSTKYYYQSGQYDNAVESAVQQLRKNPKKNKELLLLEQAYKAEFIQKMKRIDYLKAEGNPDCWVEVYDLYHDIQKIQNLVQPLLPLYMPKEYRNVDIKLVDIDAELIASKQKAAEYLYASANKLAEKPDKTSKRQAFDRYNQIKQYYSNFKDADAQAAKMYEAGQNYVSIAFNNQSRFIIPQEFVSQLSSFDSKQLNSTWVKFVSEQSGKNLDYKINVSLRDINIQPEQLRERNWREEATVEDGWKYVLDGKGNVKKDSLGNDMKETKYKTVYADVIETNQAKMGDMAVILEIIDARDRQIIKSLPFTQALVFENRFVSFRGDKRALKPETQKLLGGRFVPFPSNEQMIMDVAGNINNQIGNFIVQNKAAFEN